MVKFIEDYKKDEENICFYWYLLQLQKGDILVHKKDFYSSNFDYGIALHGFYIEKLFGLEHIYHKELITNLYELDFIKKGKILFYSGGPEDETLSLEKEIKINDKLLDSLEKLKVVYNSFFFIDIVLNAKNIENYIASYLDKWKEGNIYEEGRNFLNFKIQVDNSVSIIYRHLKKYSDKSLLISEKDFTLMSGEAINLFAVLLYLEEIGTIKIKSIENIKDTSYSAKIGYRIEILDSFYDNFKEKTSNNKDKIKDNTLY